MSIFLRVEPCHAEYAARGLAFVDPLTMSENGLKHGDVIEITTGFGKSALTRVAEPIETDAGQGFVRIDQYVRHSLKALIGDMVELNKVTVGNINRMVLAPLIDLSQMEGLEQYLIQTFTAFGLPVSQGAGLYA